MKVGIITITGEANYGNSLQNYALLKTLKDLDLDSYTIKTEYETNYKTINKVNVKRYLKILLKKGDYVNLIRRIKFSSFSSKYLNKTKKICYESNPELSGFDYLVFGSDQIWNFTWGGRIADNINFFTGGFSKEIPKISYAASIGVDFIPEEYKDTFVENISRFKSVSVREQTGKSIVESLTDKKALVLLDPTLLVSKNDWLSMAKKPKFVNVRDNYILTYFLGDVNQNLKDYIEKVSKVYNYKIIDLKSEWFNSDCLSNKAFLTADPSEFLWLISNCKILFTDSFHGSVFSILFEKSFRCFQRDSNEFGMLSRMDTLFNLLNISDWCKGDLNENIDHVFYKDYSSVNEALSQKKQESIDYLKGALGINET